mmetsp:Transcript_25210/g.76513  ORF Transcript_25210/g.76513 Transcript_25210/m.76513 type:complete len:200 (+) Transcript_25210:507-1106(+)
MCTGIHACKDFICIFGDLILHVDLGTIGLGHLTRKSIGDAEAIGLASSDLLPIVIIEDRVGVCDSKEEPSEASKGLVSRSLLHKEAPQEAAIRRNSSARCDHNEVRIGRGLRHEHYLPSGASDLDWITRLGVTKEIAAHSFLGWIISCKVLIPVESAANAKRDGVTGQVVAVARRADRVEPNRVGFAVLWADTRGDHSK